MKRTSNTDKIILSVFLILFCPFVMGAITTSQNHANFQAGSNIAANDNQTLTFNNNMFGLYGPFSLQATYSKLFGITFSGTYTQLIGNQDAAFAELDFGGKERRVSATWGHVLTSNQLVKITAENLSQKPDFDFLSGTVSQWIYQNAVGASYAYLTKHNMLHDINFNAYYSKANSKTLSDKVYTQGAISYLNHRRISGGTDKSLSAGVDFTPTITTLIGVQANYDNISYRMYNDLNAKKDDNGLGATISLDQLLTDHVKFRLLASNRKPYKDYQAQLNWLLYSVPGSNLQLGLLGENIVGNLGTRSDNRFGINLAYTWGGDQNVKPFVYGAPCISIINNLRSWVSKPSVRMEQVLALTDQSSEILSASTLSPKDQPNAAQHIIIVHPKGKKQIDVKKYFASQVKDADKIEYAVKTLPKGHDLKFKDNKLIINADSFAEKDNNKDFTVEFVPANVNSLSGLSVMSLVIAVKANGEYTPHPNPNYMPGGTPGPITLNWNGGETKIDVNPIDPQEQDLDHQLIINPFPFLRDNELHFSLVDKDGIGIKLRQDNIPWPDEPGAFYYHVYLSTDGPLPNKPGNHEIDLYAGCKYGGKSVVALPIIININDTSHPTIDVKTQPTYTQGNHVDPPQDAFAACNAGVGEKFADTTEKTIKVKAIDSKNDIHPLLDFNLRYEVTPHQGQPEHDFTDADITIYTLKGEVVRNPVYSPQKYQITATNEDAKHACKNFTLTVVAKPPHHLYARCPNLKTDYYYYYYDPDMHGIYLCFRVTEYKKVNGKLEPYTYDFEANRTLTHEMLKDGTLKNAFISGDQLIATYSFYGGEVNFMARPVPKKGAKNFTFVHHKKGDPAFCDTGQDYCEFYYDMSSS